MLRGWFCGDLARRAEASCCRMRFGVLLVSVVSRFRFVRVRIAGILGHMADDSGGCASAAPILVCLVDDCPSTRRSMSRAFMAWARRKSALRVFFTPDVFVALDHKGRRGYLYDDGWFLECWVEEGVDEFVGLLEREFSWHQGSAYVVSRESPPIAGLIVFALERGMSMKKARHLL